MSEDAVLERATSEVLVVFKGHADDDEDSSWAASFFYLPRSRTIPKSGLILSYFLDWLIIRWSHFFLFLPIFLCLALFVAQVYIYLALPSCTP